MKNKYISNHFLLILRMKKQAIMRSKQAWEEKKVVRFGQLAGLTLTQP